MPFPIDTRLDNVFLPALSQEISRLTDEAVPVGDPFFIRMLGVPGVGKSTLSALIAEELRASSPTIIGFDRLLEVIPEYQRHPCREEAVSIYGPHAQAACHMAIKCLIDKKANIIFDNGGWLPEHVKILEYACAEKGYRASVVHVTADSDLSKMRVRLRGLQDGRYTPPEVIDERLRILPTLLDSYRAVAGTFFHVSNNNNSSAALGRLRKKGVKIAAVVSHKPLRPPRMLREAVSTEATA